MKIDLRTVAEEARPKVQEMLEQVEVLAKAHLEATNQADKSHTWFKWTRAENDLMDYVHDNKRRTF